MVVPLQVSRQIVANNGGVVLAETDELIGAEAYVLEKLRDLSTGQKFLGMIDRCVLQRADAK